MPTPIEFLWNNPTTGKEYAKITVSDGDEGGIVFEVEHLDNANPIAFYLNAEEALKLRNWLS